ncbi:MAG TPA: GH1 family beta-glucosidase [Steroidobacteraceae bacterium]|jgi:beta-glucosidase|nr:GH1 family beta-glucosidase [Steroidobacteraceae bacterium]
MSDSRAEALARRFPHDFAWGVATSAYQIEGATTADGRGPSIWDDFCRMPGTIADGSSGESACDHYNRLQSDLDLMQRLGIAAYRFSISWPRIRPDGGAANNEPGLAFYDRLVDGLLSRGIQPFATLYHWDLPSRLQHESGGWADRGIADAFADYAGAVAARLGDRVKSFTTHNEPWVTATLGYETGVFAPGIKSRATAMQAAHHCLVSHGLAAEAVRAARADAAVGIVLNLSPVYPESDAPQDVLQARRDDGLLVRWYLDALLLGHYPEDVLEYLGPDAPHTRSGDARLIAAPLDFLGVNFYNPMISSASRRWIPARKGAPVTDMGWEVAPRDLTQLLLRLHREYRLPPLYIAENGAAYEDRLVDGEVNDEPRRAYLESHLEAVAAAIEQGVDLRGYFVWSLLDNFEWSQGYARRFGIVHVDYATQERRPKRSGLWYRELVRCARRISATAPARECPA